MAELLLKVDEGANYADGDCLCAFSDRHIRCAHAEMICHPKRSQRSPRGMLVKGSLAWHWMRRTREFRFERLSKTEMVRINQATNERVRFGPESIDLRLYLKRRRENKDHQLFTDGQTVVWFGGRSDFSAVRINTIWEQIDKQTPWNLTRQRFQLWPMGRLDIRHHLAIRSEAITEKQVRDFTEPLYRTNDNGEFAWRIGKEIGFSAAIDDPPDDRNDWRLIVARKRRRRIAWRELLGDISETETRIRDRRQVIGHEINDEDGIRYTSKTQTLQQLTRIRKKAAITR